VTGGLTFRGGITVAAVEAVVEAQLLFTVGARKTGPAFAASRMIFILLTVQAKKRQRGEGTTFHLEVRTEK